MNLSWHVGGGLQLANPEVSINIEALEGYVLWSCRHLENAEAARPALGAQTPWLLDIESLVCGQYCIFPEATNMGGCHWPGESNNVKKSATK